MPKRVLIILEAGDAYPSGFIRGLIYRDSFAKNGVEARYMSRLYPSLMRFLDQTSHVLLPFLPKGRGGGAPHRILNYLAWPSETAILQAAKQYDVVYMSKVRSVRLITQLRRHTRARLVLDFGDALWLPSRHVEGFNEILTQVHAVTTDNELTANYVRQINPHCVVIPDCPQIEWFDRRRLERSRRFDEKVILGWVGTVGTAYNLYLIWESLEHLFAKYPNLHLRLVGVPVGHPSLPPFEKVDYSCRSQYNQESMIQEVFGMHIGLFPLQDTTASLVRGVLKAAVYMSGEAAVVASPIGQVPELIRDGQNGFLARSTLEWEDKIGRLIEQPDLRYQFTQAGLESVRSHFTVELSFAKLLSVLFPG